MYDLSQVKVSNSPHIRSEDNTRQIMLDVIIAMLPALVWGIINWGINVLLLTAVSVVGCMFWEWLYRKLMKLPQSVGDLSAAVTGLLLALLMSMASAGTKSPASSFMMSPGTRREASMIFSSPSRMTLA